MTTETVKVGPPEGAATHPGAVLKTLRKKRGLTLGRLHELTGLPVSTLSKVENGKMALSYDKLVRLSAGLHVDIGRFFGSPDDDARRAEMPEATSMRGRRSIARKGGGSAITTENYGHLYPAADLLNKKMTPIIAEVKARSLEDFGDLVRHGGEEYAYVLQGRVALHTDTYAPVILETGDSIYFDASMGHAYVALDDGPCRVLSVCSTEPTESEPATDTTP